MQHYSKILAAVLVLISLGFVLGPQAFAQGNITGESYIRGDRYMNIIKPTGGTVETCIDNNSNLVCDVTEPNAPPSCRYDGVHCDMTPGQNVTQGPSSTRSQ